ncbi:MAG: trigger factor [Flavobacteriales bacterium]|nr:trigger factor [Flavobacteriales bacterium]MBP9080608.1 trigger factor [Flavobacteriales bacterium]
MNIEREETGTLTATLMLKLDTSDYAPAVEKVLKEQRKTAAWPGFRPGQVPMSIIRKRIGKSVLVNEVERLVDSNLRTYIEQQKLRVLGQPLPNQEAADVNNWDEPGEFHFRYEVGMAPAVEVAMDSKLDVKLPLVDVNDELVDKEVADMQRRFGKLSDAATAADKDMLIGDLIELDATGEIKPGGLMNRTTITLEDLAGEVRSLFLGKAAGDAVDVDPHTISKGHDDLAKMLATGHEAVHHLAGNMRFRIAEIKRMEALEAGPELFERVYGPGAVADEADFRAKVKQGMEEMFLQDSERIYKRLVVRALMEQASIELPDTFLKRWIAVTNQKPITPEEVESGYADYAEGLRKQLTQDRIVEKYGLEAKVEEITEFAKRYMAEQFAQYGMPAPEEAKLQEMAGRMLGEQDQVRKIRDTIVERKLIAHFKAMLSPKEERLTLDDFVNLARKA